MGTDVCADMVYEAIKAGYRHLDGAAAYGNEKEVGQGIKRALDEGIVKREDLFVTTKLWNTFHHKEHVEMAFMRSLTDMGLDYVDLYLIHFPVSLKFVPFEQNYPPDWKYNEELGMIEDPVSYIETWKAMEELVDKKLVKSIGCSNIGTQLMREVLCIAKHKPAVLQVEMHPYLTQERLLRFCKEKGIAVTAFSPFGANSYVDIGFGKPEEMIIKLPLIAEIGKKHGKTPGQVLLRWAVQRGTIVIPKTSRVERLAENINIYDFTISDDDMKAISALDKHRRFNDPGYFGEAVFGLFYPIHD
jgi:diketogulonate reductase-like aldo/keto reductase